jgi:hypothetical protein
MATNTPSMTSPALACIAPSHARALGVVLRAMMGCLADHVLA